MNLSMVPTLAWISRDMQSKYFPSSGTMRSPSRSESPVKPAISANSTVIGRIEPPGRASTPCAVRVRTMSPGRYLPNAASPFAMSAIAADRFAIELKPFHVAELGRDFHQRPPDDPAGEPGRE